MAADPRALRELVARNRREAIDLSTRVGRRRMRELLARAENDLVVRLHRAEGLGGPGKDSFTSAQLRATLAQVRDVTRVATRRLRGVLVDQVGTAADHAAGQLVDYLGRADRAFRGLGHQPLQLREAAVLDAAREGAQSSLLRRLASSGEPVASADGQPHPAKRGVLERYGVETIGHFEGILERGLITRKPWGEVRAELVEASPFLQQAPAHWAERIVRTECLVGSTLVSGAVIRAAHRRWYEGDVVVIVTEAGREFTTTPNHPMLARRGWVSAKLLERGDNLICDRRQQRSRSSRDEDVENAPATIAEVFESLCAVGVKSRRSSAKHDFHGDGMNGYVDVACPNGKLSLGQFAPIHEPLAQLLFSPADFSRLRFCTLCSRLLSVDEQPCCCGASSGNASLLQSLRYDAAAYFEVCSEALRAFPSNVARDYFLRRQLKPTGVADDHEAIARCLGSSSYDGMPSEISLEPIAPAPSDVGGSISAAPPKIEFDRVRSVRIERFSGHVYNLTTPYGYFAINGAYTGNTMGAFNRAGWEGTKEANRQLGDVVKVLSETFDERTGADSFAVHGQIRRNEEPFDSWYGQMMHPPARPNDRAVVTPHRKSWPIPEYLKPRTDGDVLARWRLEGRKGAPPPRPRQTTVPYSSFGRG